MASILDALSQFSIPLEFSIWDINASTIKKIFDHTVEFPDFTNPAKLGQIMVITIIDKIIANQVRAQFEPLGYTVYHGVKELLQTLK
jgi:hypothetical protein